MLFKKQLDYIVDEIVSDVLDHLPRLIAKSMALETLTVKIVSEPPPEPPPPPNDEPDTLLIEVTDGSRLYREDPDYKDAERIVLTKVFTFPKVEPRDRFTAFVGPVPVDSSCGDSHAWALSLGKDGVSFFGYYLPRNVCKKV